MATVKPLAGLSFSTPFRALFGSLSPLHVAWVLILFFKGTSNVQNGLGRIFLDFIIHFLPGMKKGTKRGAKREQKRSKKKEQKGRL
jgi:hypothetical protein